MKNGYAMQPKLSRLAWRPLKAFAAKDAPSAVDHISFTSGSANCHLRFWGCKFQALQFSQVVLARIPLS